MRPDFLAPENAMLTKTMSIITDLLKTPNTDEKKELLEAFKKARNGLLHAKKTYDHFFSLEMTLKICTLLIQIENQTTLMTRFLTEAESLLAIYENAPLSGNDAEEVICNLDLSQFSASPEEEVTPEDLDEDEDENTKLISNGLILIDHIETLKQKLDKVEKIEASITTKLIEFTDIINTTEEEKKDQRAKTLKNIIKELVKNIHLIQKKYSIEENDYTLIDFYYYLKNGPCDLIEKFNDACNKKADIINRFIQISSNTACENSKSEDESETSFSSNSSGFFSRSNSGTSLSANNESEYDDDFDAPKRKLARTI